MFPGMKDHILMRNALILPNGDEIVHIERDFKDSERNTKNTSQVHCGYVVEPYEEACTR